MKLPLFIPNQSLARFSVVVAVFFCAVAVRGQNLVTNGSFTGNAALFTTYPGYVGGGNPTNVTGWTQVAGTAGGYGVNGAGTTQTAFAPVNSGGATFLFIQGAGKTLAQTLPGMVTNTPYTLSFLAAARYQPTESNDWFQVQVGDSASVCFSTGNMLASNAAFQACSYNFTSPAAFFGLPAIQLTNGSPSGDHTVDFTAVSIVQTRTTAETFTWTNLAGGNASGSWANQADWSGGTLPTVALDTVNFNALDITTNSTVTLDGNQTVNAVNFSDTNSATAASWIINPGDPSSSTLTLGGASPAIKVAGLAGGQAAVINAAVAGTNGFTFSGTSYLQLNANNTYSGTTIISGSNTRISFGNGNAFGAGVIQVGGPVGDGQIWFNPAGNLTLTNAMEINTIRWIIDNATVNGVSAGTLTVDGNVLLNTGASNVRDIYCNEPLIINGNVSVTPSSNPLNKNGGYSLTLNGTNTVGGASAVNGGSLIINGLMNGGATFTVNSGELGGTGVISGPVSVASGGTLSPGNNGSGTLTCGTLTSVAGAQFNFGFGPTNNATNGFIKVNGNVTLVGALNITDLGGFSAGVYTGLQYTGSATVSGLTNGVIPGGKVVVVTTNASGYVLFNVLNGTLNPSAGEKLPMDLTSPLALGWVQAPGATAYDVYFGASSNAVATASTNTAGIYQGRTGVLVMNISGLQPNTIYYWRVDGVAANGTPTKGTVFSFTTGAAMLDLMEDTWVATDALDRSLPGMAQCGSPVTNRPIGLFYFLWQGSSSSLGSGTNWDVTRYLSANPFANPHDPWASDPIMQTVQDTYWWGQPALNYYNPLDPWVLRRQIALICHAGVDVLIFDYSNATAYPAQLDALLNMIRQMRFEGYQIHLKITFLTHANSGSTVTALYDTLYGPGNYSDLWFYWQGKPLILGSINGSGGSDIVPSSTVQNFFTWRYSWAWVGGYDTIAWIDSGSPQKYGYSAASDHPESTPVTCGGWASSNIGHSYVNDAEPDHNGNDLPVTGAQGLGLFFGQQMYFGLKYDPQFMYITGWNEWIAGSFASPSACGVSLLGDCCPAGGYYFVDEYDEEFSRDLEPMQGGHTDNYYYQLVAQDRWRKGVRPVPPASAPQTINLPGGFAQWTNVAPAYYDPVNDTIWRNYAGASASQMGIYTNSTGRNDFTQMKVARDANNFYFLAQCNSNLTSYLGSNWMVLFIDADQNHLTGWEGYDYAVNLGGVSSNTTTLSRNTTTADAWAWTPVRSDINYTVSGNQLMLAIPRASLGLANDPVSFDFKWADNFQTNDIADFGVDGDTAPDRRFNYRYSTTTNSETVLLSDDFEIGQQSVWGVTWTNGSKWSLTTNSPYLGNHCVVCTNGTGQSNLIASVSTAGWGSFRLNFHYKLNMGGAQNLFLYYYGANGWVPIRALSRSEYYPVNQAWSYNEISNVWLNFTDTRMNRGEEAQFFSTNFAFRIDGSAVTSASMNVWVDTVKLTACSQMPAPASPQTWQTLDIGHAGNIGSVSTNGNLYTITGAGGDIWNNGDAFRFLYQTRTGDGTLTARVTSQTVSDPWAKAGVMIRELTDTGARNALTALTPGNNVTFQYRSIGLGPCASVAYGSGLTPPYWVRLVRSGTNFTSYASANGTTWAQVGSASLAGFNGTALWGLAVTAHNNTTNSTAIFDNVTFTQIPAISTISNQMLVAGQTLILTNFIVNVDTPPLTLTWGLLSGPSGMNLGASSGILNWRPMIAQSPTTNLISLMVADSGTPSLSATQSFIATVLRPAPPAFSALGCTNGQFAFTVNGNAGPDYSIFSSTNLALTNWLLLQQFSSPSLPFSFVDESATNFSLRFYQIQLSP